MSLLFSSHLLPDVEAVCDYVIVLGAGKLLAEGKIQELKQVHHQSFDVRLKAEPAPFARSCWSSAVRVELRDDQLRVRLPEGRSPQMLWELAARTAPADPLPAAPAQHAGRSVSQGRGTNRNAHLRSRLSTLVGHLSGHAWRWLAITRHGVRVALKGRLLRIVLLVPGCRRLCWPRFSACGGWWNRTQL